MERHPLAKWIEAQDGKISKSEVAAAIGCKPQTLSGALKGDHGFGRDKMLAIEKLTKGAVSVRDLVAWEPPDRAA